MPVIILIGAVFIARLIFGAPFDPARRNKTTIVRVEGQIPSKPPKSLIDILYPWALLALALYVMLDTLAGIRSRG